MNILITGITGLFGGYLAKEFSAIGSIYGFHRPESTPKLAIKEDLEVIWRTGSLDDPDSLRECLEGIDLVIHAAGLVSFLSRDQNQLYHVNRDGTANLVNAMLDAGVRKLLYVSSVAAIGRSAEHPIIDEDFKWIDSPLTTDYALSKYLGELEAWRGEQENLDLIVVNPSILLGKASYGKSSSAIYSYVTEENSYYPAGDINYIDVRDAAEITRILVQKQLWGERFILNKESLSYREFFQAIAKAFGKKAPARPLQAWMIQVASFGTAILKVLGLTKSPLNKQTAKLAQQKITFSNRKISKELGFRYRSLEETLEWAKTP